VFGKTTGRVIGPRPDVDTSFADDLHMVVAERAGEGGSAVGDVRRAQHDCGIDVTKQGSELAVGEVRIQRGHLSARGLCPEVGDRHLDRVGHHQRHRVAPLHVGYQMGGHASDRPPVLAEGDLVVTDDQRDPVGLELGGGIERMDHRRMVGGVLGNRDGRTSGLHERDLSWTKVIESPPAPCHPPPSSVRRSCRRPRLGWSRQTS
jgi:hypothetical protein